MLFECLISSELFLPIVFNVAIFFRVVGVKPVFFPTFKRSSSPSNFLKPRKSSKSTKLPKEIVFPFLFLLKLSAITLLYSLFEDNLAIKVFCAADFDTTTR